MSERTTTAVGGVLGFTPLIRSRKVGCPGSPALRSERHTGESERARTVAYSFPDSGSRAGQAATTSTASAGALMVTRSSGRPVTEETDNGLSTGRIGAGTVSLAAD